MSVNEGFEEWEATYLQNDVNFNPNVQKIFVKPDLMTKRIRLFPNRWFEVLKLNEPLGLSVNEFRDLERPLKSFIKTYQYGDYNIAKPYQRLLDYCKSYDPNIVSFKINWTCQENEQSLPSDFEYHVHCYSSEDRQRYFITLVMKVDLS